MSWRDSYFESERCFLNPSTEFYGKPYWRAWSPASSLPQIITLFLWPHWRSNTVLWGHGNVFLLHPWSPKWYIEKRITSRKYLKLFVRWWCKKPLVKAPESCTVVAIFKEFLTKATFIWTLCLPPIPPPKLSTEVPYPFYKHGSQLFQREHRVGILCGFWRSLPVTAELRGINRGGRKLVVDSPVPCKGRCKPSTLVYAGYLCP